MRTWQVQELEHSGDDCGEDGVAAQRVISSLMAPIPPVAPLMHQLLDALESRVALHALELVLGDACQHDVGITNEL